MERGNFEREFRRGLAAWRLGRREEAAETFRRVVETGSSDPRHLSYHGLMLAAREHEERAGLELCERATLLRPEDQAMHVNLARARNAVGRRAWAVTGLRRALESVSDREPILAELDRLSPRRHGPLTFLDRGNPINRTLGRFQRGRTGAHRTS